ncbi:MAG: hypothetical protein ACLQPD_15715 [Desulfomonilaceae bacterium]
MLNATAIEDNLDESESKRAGMLTFKCPICGSDTIAEVWHGVFDSICIGGLVPGVGAVVKGVTHDNGQAKFGGYYCANCSYALVNSDGKKVKSEKDLVDFLEMLSEDHDTAEEYRRLHQVKSDQPAAKYYPECQSEFDQIDEMQH